MSETHDQAKQDALNEINKVAKDFGEGPVADIEPLVKQPKWGYEPTGDEKTMAMLAHLCAFFFSMIGPVLILAIKGGESEFVRYHAMQALIFQVASFLVVFPVVMISCGMGFPIAFLPWIGAIIYGMKANNGEWEGYPLIEGMGK